ncbi:transcription termination/antitermination NusG family protein [Aliikangiella coralliicola]|uniref:NusG-like N-terminal domain-containing protein n=1 Tax=Aliikangiella coralliicola TaxID=2592383 RepID=A0A545U966_9GAMM|nr:transcription termination/antitermination NusG family protein [Aliikangiella coralliicola]TQV86017.1 hypothetical protein FLL46_19085 [Aliikangiella coralliicola]
MKVWFVIYCKPQKDEVAEKNLLRQGFEVYRPLISRARGGHVGGSPSIREESLFPRYLFLNVDPEIKPITPVKYTPGVVGFVTFGDRYSTVDDSVINDIKVCESEQQMDLDNSVRFREGETVYINGEGFTDIKATFCEMSSDNRVIVLLKMLGRMSTITIPSSYVSRTSAY